MTLMPRAAAPILAALALAACQAPSPPGDQAATRPAGSAPAPAAKPESAPPPAAADAIRPRLVDRVWRAKDDASTVEPGTTYAFLGDGTLVIESPHGTPMTGQWRLEDGRLTMVEEGVPYDTEIVELDAATLHLRSHNPAGTLDIPLVLAPDAPLPAPRR
ncbi:MULTISPECIES: hypothetical protein [Gammaproteobacteria]|uniref:hypothetical protein n=1 Tax=Gammaproteobacteria TaxID=1236 RepID=UPI0011285853|nr:hypothetical protein [Pseudomonas sp. Hp2]